MFIAIIPAKNESKSLRKVIANLPLNYLDCIIPVLNGCTDNSLAMLNDLHCPILSPLWFKEPLGIDIPRAVGAIKAMRLNAKGVLFIDGDMFGASQDMLTSLILAVREQGLDLALTNCYPEHNKRQVSPPAAHLLKVREFFNRQLNVYDLIGTATPSHGPHTISGRLLRKAEPSDFAIPPMLLVRAAKEYLRIGVAAEITHSRLGSPLRSADHADKIAATILGDYMSALNTKNGKLGPRTLEGHEYVGYHNERRWDLIEAL